MSADSFINNRKDFATSIGKKDLYDYVDHFGLYAGLHTIGNKLWTYELFKKSVGVPGDIAEFGCWKGSNLLFLTKTLTLLEPNSYKNVYGFDNFSGLPAPSSEDGAYAKDQIGKYHGNEEVLKKAIDFFGFKEKVVLVKGDALETIPKFKQENKHIILSFAYLDFDLYDPTKVALNFIDECISVGGIIVFDEACTSIWPGETLAMKEFMKNSSNKFKMISNTLSKQPTVALQRIE